ncbi:MAG: Short-chain fatty acids transporter [Bacteroidetes bacterium ADurb.Bin139]|nr:MAG: Short-chain fatty acids transporter [Bacteroidetes bacterium ADurb.Bin139]
MILALAFGDALRPGLAGVADVLVCWTEGFWDLLAFSMQMVLILLLGYMLALVFGAILVKKIAEQAARTGSAINYPLLGASAYVCMMVWHGGLSGSAPLSVASQGHFLVDTTGIIPLTLTIFSPMNLVSWGALIVLIPLASWFYARKHEVSVPVISDAQATLASVERPANVPEPGNLPASASLPSQGTHSFWMPLSGALLLAGSVAYAVIRNDSTFGLDQVNLILFALVLLAFPNAGALGEAADKAVKSTTGIIIQFPLYAGIMGIMKYSGLLVVITNWFVSISSLQTLPLFSFLSAGLVNLFVPSGGGQWAVQGPVLIQAAGLVGVDYAKEVMALAYGDQLTNMLQPFWALPLLGITGLKAGQIFRYSLPYMLVGLVIFSLVLLLF